MTRCSRAPLRPGDATGTKHKWKSARTRRASRPYLGGLRYGLRLGLGLDTLLRHAQARCATAAAAANGDARRPQRRDTTQTGRRPAGQGGGRHKGRHGWIVGRGARGGACTVITLAMNAAQKWDAGESGWESGWSVRWWSQRSWSSCGGTVVAAGARKR